MKKILIGIIGVIIVVALAGMYKFNYLANQEGYDVDGNKIPPVDLPQVKNCAADGSGCKQFNPNKLDKPKVVQNLKSVNPQEFKALAETGEYTIIDVRTPAELLPENGGKIFEEAINIDFYEPDFLQKLMKLDRDEKYLIYCRSGNRSGKTLELMGQSGFLNVINLEKGKVTWDKVYSGKIKKKPLEPEVCIEETKVCPGGSAVGRTGPNCEFTACPNTKAVSQVKEEITKISISEIAEHNTKTNCWGAINGKVYDVTGFFGKHPGGDQNLFRICGIDATSVFRLKHGGDSKPNEKLKSFYIGDLIQ